ncbi:MAG: DUF2341 domain-containing protein [Sedimentisphaerales bacterium]|nr:DUF2341 domain-containing protein [Sedimentisphaerales bacterium]
MCYTLQNDYVDSDLTDFPLYVKISSDADIGAHAQSDGDDIRFTLADGVTVIPHEKESFSIDSGDATGHFWVKVPTINSSSTTDIYIYYGNSEASNGDDPNNVWDDNYLGVWHYSEDSWDGTSGEIKDSTSNNCNGARGGSATTTADGKIGRGGAFNAVGYAALFGVDNIDNAFTLSAWVLNNNDLEEESGAWLGWPIVAQGFYYYIGWQGWSDGWTVCFKSDGTQYKMDTYNKYLTADTWYHINGVYDSSSLYIYSNGESIGSSSKGDHDVNDVSTVISGDANWDGLIDEVRVSNTNRSADWLKFEYRNIAEADNELTFSSEEEAPEVTTPSDMIGNPYMFTGRRFDLETELYYYRARYYNPYIGKFLQTDPAYSSMNLYAYCGNNPVNWVDPTGMLGGITIGGPPSTTQPRAHTGLWYLYRYTLGFGKEVNLNTDDRGLLHAIIYDPTWTAKARQYAFNNIIEDIDTKWIQRSLYSIGIFENLVPGDSIKTNMTRNDTSAYSFDDDQYFVWSPFYLALGDGSFKIQTNVVGEFTKLGNGFTWIITIRTTFNVDDWFTEPLDFEEVGIEIPGDLLGIKYHIKGQWKETHTVVISYINGIWKTAWQYFQ